MDASLTFDQMFMGAPEDEYAPGTLVPVSADEQQQQQQQQQQQKKKRTIVNTAPPSPPKKRKRQASLSSSMPPPVPSSPSKRQRRETLLAPAIEAYCNSLLAITHGIDYAAVADGLLKAINPSNVWDDEPLIDSAKTSLLKKSKYVTVGINAVSAASHFNPAAPTLTVVLADGQVARVNESHIRFYLVVNEFRTIVRDAMSSNNNHHHHHLLFKLAIQCGRTAISSTIASPLVATNERSASAIIDLTGSYAIFSNSPLAVNIISQFVPQ